MNATKILNPELPALTLEPTSTQKIHANLKESAFRKFLADFKSKLRRSQSTDLDLEEWRRLEYRNEWQAEGQDHRIKFLL